ncbi:hypothetical protein FJ434_23525 [Mesorhizobium sp. B2-5-13]|uniref:hypothetical protein n=1 Tax=unclassified Mesorhizobium TaxID=325217 RepID=UPI0011276F75|nr:MULTISPECIES: hypothetical protein [unclassified Mesorhizobium]TPJ78789.1 hypothetical protein FJ434_23525 [Mesorhizobium sp. B2-5-13]TPK45003.1 hypothetical protein FJ560_22000 [Mesorhizobium sp. B2-5-5]
MSLVIAMLAFVKPAPDTGYGSSHLETAAAVAPEELRKAMLEFVEALAVADARRDHFVAIDSSINRSSAIDSRHARKAPKI